jgi:hypothetical protein
MRVRGPYGMGEQRCGQRWIPSYNYLDEEVEVEAEGGGGSAAGGEEGEVEDGAADPTVEGNLASTLFWVGALFLLVCLLRALGAACYRRTHRGGARDARGNVRLPFFLLFPWPELHVVVIAFAGVAYACTAAILASCDATVAAGESVIKYKLH